MQLLLLYWASLDILAASEHPLPCACIASWPVGMRCDGCNLHQAGKVKFQQRCKQQISL